MRNSTIEFVFNFQNDYSLTLSLNENLQVFNNLEDAKFFIRVLKHQKQHKSRSFRQMTEGNMLFVLNRGVVPTHTPLHKNNYCVKFDPSKYYVAVGIDMSIDDLKLVADVARCSNVDYKTQLANEKPSKVYVANIQDYINEDISRKELSSDDPDFEFKNNCITRLSNIKATTFDSSDPVMDCIDFINENFEKTIFFNDKTRTFFITDTNYDVTEKPLYREFNPQSDAIFKDTKPHKIILNCHEDSQILRSFIYNKKLEENEQKRRKQEIEKRQLFNKVA